MLTLLNDIELQIFSIFNLLFIISGLCYLRYSPSESHFGKRLDIYAEKLQETLIFATMRSIKSVGIYFLARSVFTIALLCEIPSGARKFSHASILFRPTGELGSGHASVFLSTATCEAEGCRMTSVWEPLLRSIIAQSHFLHLRENYGLAIVDREYHRRGIADGNVECIERQAMDPRLSSSLRDASGILQGN